MGNRAVITASKSKTTGVGIYLHWNGGIESVEKFLAECRKRDYRSPAVDEQYAMARLCGLICEMLPGETGVGIGQLKELDCDNFDNGVYVIGRNWEIVDRWGKGSPSIAD